MFTRHSGTCIIVGDKANETLQYELRLGDYIRLGSVGLVVTEIRIEGQEAKCIDSKTLAHLKDEALLQQQQEEAGMYSNNNNNTTNNDNANVNANVNDDNNEQQIVAPSSGSGPSSSSSSRITFTVTWSY